MDLNYLIEYSGVSKWHWWYKGRNRILLSLFKRYLTFDEDSKILDLGCGPRSILEDFDRQRKGKIFGIDYCLEAAQLYRKNNGFNVCLSTVKDLPFKSVSFTGILILDVLEHIDNDKDVLREAIRVSKPGCIIFVTVPAFKFLWGKHDIISRHKKRYTIGNLLQVLRSKELQLIKISYFNFLLFPIVFAIRTFNKVILDSFDKTEAKLKSDFSLNRRGVINRILLGIFSLESRFILFFNFPFGSSIVCILKRKSVYDF